MMLPLDSTSHSLIRRTTQLTTPNILVFGVDSLRADHLSCYGYHRLTSPRIDRLASQGALFEKTFSPHIPTTSGFTSMLSGLDVFSSQVVALEHRGGIRPEVTMLPELLKDRGYDTICVGFSGNPSSRDSTPTSTTGLGAIGTKGLSTRPRTSTAWPSPNSSVSLIRIDHSS